MEGVRVLSVEDSRYAADEAALAEAAAAAGAARLPVAVVSVAGAARGGKSFLLDFFLRYLRATEEARDSGAWLGDEDEPLTGFGWRGGCDRHTEGILMWHEPIIVNIGSEHNKEEVAVILLDTQGSFDSSSTIRDSSTVFAISTLLSSVQIYNLSQNIQEDNLQYLQLFTEYGKLARDEHELRPFQELRFLVRDWAWHYQHPYGAVGGQELLDKRLQISDEQAQELREVRAHIRGVFERVSAFLLPHPGLAVASNPAFTGCLKDISPEFKETLLELVPSLFAPERLAVKQINGQTVTLQDFVEYFKTYVDIFNSDTLPTPTTVMQATSAASLETAVRACRAEYAARMSRSARGAACLPRSALARHHAAALHAVRAAFQARRTFVAPEAANARLEDLIRELETSLAERIAINNAHILEAAAGCKVAYETEMQTDKCLTPADLEEKHRTAIDVAKVAFDAAFAPLEDDHSTRGSVELDDDHSDGDYEEIRMNWDTVKQDLQQLLPLYRERNETRIEAAMTQARETYLRLMREGLSVATCFHPRSLRSLHRDSAAAARDDLRNMWQDEISPQEQKQLLRTWTERQYGGFTNINNANNRDAIDVALTHYRDIMREVCDDELGRCLHPQDLVAQHERAQRSASARFLQQRDPASGDAPPDEHQRNLSWMMIPVYKEFEQRNVVLNKEAVKRSHEYYMRHITPLRGGVEGILEIFGPPDLEVFTRHVGVKEDAIDQFLLRRRPGDARGNDPYLEDLKKKIEDSYSWIVTKVLLNMAAQAATLFAAGNMFRR